MRTPVRFLIALLVAGVVACGDDAADQPGTDKDPVTGGGATGGGDGDELETECDEAPEGTPCGGSSRDMHCIFDACVENACGDGVRAGAEACDDGNERDGDGCDERCREEECGNGVVDFAEA